MGWFLLVRAVVFAAGVFLVISTVLGAIRSFVLPRNESVLITNWVFRSLRYLFSMAARLKATYAGRDRVMALYAPTGLVALPIAWLGIVATGYTAIFWAVGEGSLGRCYRLSCSSLLTLGSENAQALSSSVLVYSEAALGLLLMTLLISYLPTMYQAFSRRELVVSRLELRAGTPASAECLLEWLDRTGSLSDDGRAWEQWEAWFVEIEESHTSLGILAFFRSPQPGRSWVMAATIILDAAALMLSAVDQPRHHEAELCFKAGCVAINRVYRYFQGAHADPAIMPDTTVDDPARQDFQSAYDQLQQAGIALKDDPAACWKHYHELRGRYREALEYLAQLTMSPEVKPL